MVCAALCGVSHLGAKSTKAPFILSQPILNTFFAVGERSAQTVLWCIRQWF
jgi:hypothetical protein